MAMESKNKAMITACEKNRIRVDKLKYNIERQGAKGINVMLEDARKLSDFFSFDKILLDAPCSGSGTLNIRKVASPDVQVASQPHESRKLNLVAPEKSCDFSYAIKNIQKNSFTEELVKRSIKTQEELLKKALKILKPGSEMVYSTCSILKDENENLLNRVLQKENATILSIDKDFFKDVPMLPVTIEGTVCVAPNELYEGFFVAKIRKN